jgi:hypothetical protein
MHELLLISVLDQPVHDLNVRRAAFLYATAARGLIPTATRLSTFGHFNLRGTNCGGVAPRAAAENSDVDVHQTPPTRLAVTCNAKSRSSLTFDFLDTG